MRISLRTGIPIVCAVICGAAVLFFLVIQMQWIMKESRFSSKETPQATGSGQSFVFPQRTLLSSDQALLSLREGDLFAQEGEWGKAQQSYEKAAMYGGGLPALRSLARAQLQQRDISGIQQTLKRLEQASARPEDILLLQSILLLHTGELVQARELLQKAGESPQKQYGLALLSIMEGNHQEAAQELEKVTMGWDPVLRTYARILQGAYDEFSLFPEGYNIHLITLLARALAQVNECELALPLLVQVTQQQPDYRDAWIVQGFCELTTERPQQALASFERAYAIDPRKPETQYFLGKTYAALRDDNNAIRFLEYALKNGFPEEQKIRQTLANIALKIGENERAFDYVLPLTQTADAPLNIFRKAIEIALLANQAQQAMLLAKEAQNRWPGSEEVQSLWQIIEERTQEGPSSPYLSGTGSDNG